MYVNYHESKELREDINISFPVKYYPEYKIDIFCIVTKENPHINIYYGEGAWSATKCARISLLEPKYLYPKDCDIPVWILCFRKYQAIMVCMDIYTYIHIGT